MNIKRRNMLVQCLLMLVTLTGYSIYWYYVTCREMSDALKRRDEVGLWTVLLFVPFICTYSFYKQGELYEIISGKAVDRWITLIFWSIFPPAAWFIIQRKLNDFAEGKAQLPAPTETPSLA